MLGKFVTVWELENLCIQILLLFGDLQSQVRRRSRRFEDFLSIFGEFKLDQFLLFKLSLLHVDYFCQIVVVCEGRIVEYV